MYNFIDVNEASEGVVLPSEALKINGQYIEDQISGYRTLNVKGREAHSPEVETITTGVRDGSRIKGKRYPERIITVTYQLIAKSNEEFREAYNKLGAILNVKEAQLIFNDEQDKFFTGTPCIIGAVPPGLNSVVGEFEIVCTDPFKYSVMEYEATANLIDNGFLIDYNGTHKAYPTLEAEFYNENESDAALTGNGDCGYVAFFNEDEKIIQLGDPDEPDTESYAKSQTLVSQMFDKETAWGTIPQANWASNVESLKMYNYTPGGNVNMAVSGYLTTVSPTTSGTLLSKRSSAAKPYIDYTVTAEATGRQADRVNVKVTVKAAVGTIGTTVIAPALPVLLNNTKLYVSSDATSSAGTRSGSYFFWDASIKNGRVRITNKILNVGKSGQVTGWVNVADINGTTTGSLGKEYGLKAAIQLGSSGWKYITLKSENTSWKQNNSYTATLNVTVKDLEADTTRIEDIKFKVERTDDTDDKIGIIDETDCADLEISTYTAPVANEWYLSPETYGSGTDYNGPSITRVIPADAAGDVGATNFRFTFRYKIGIGTSSYATQERGAQTVLLISGSGSNRKVLAGATIFKFTNGTTGRVYLYLNGELMGSVSIDLSNSKATAARTGTITKIGGQVTFDIGDTKKVYNCPEIANVGATEITFQFARYKTNPALSYNGIFWAKFVKDNCDTWNDIPNKFSANDVVTADCRNGEVLLNGTPTPSLGALGNDWEGFCLTPGLNQIGFSYSDWVADEYAPTFRVRYREVFL